MSGSTLILILKSLLPFAKEIFLKDKDLKEFLLENKIATALSLCLICVFLLFLYMSEVADKALDEVKQLKQSSAYQETVNSELRSRVTEMKTQISNLETKNTELTNRLLGKSDNPKPTRSDAGRHATTPAKKKQVEASLKSFIESSLKNPSEPGH